jgi:hypothetical protein
MAQADSQSTTHRAFLGSPETQPAANAVISPSAVPVPDAVAVSDPEASDPIFAAIDAHRREPITSSKAGGLMGNRQRRF